MHTRNGSRDLNEVYEIQHASMSEIWLRENVVSYEETKQQKKEKVYKDLVKEKDQ